MNLPKFALSHKPIVLGIALVMLAWGLNVFLDAPRREDPEFTIREAVITTDWPGCRETVVDGKNGFLVAVRDTPALVKSMRAFLENPDLVQKMGGESRKIAVAKFDVNEVNAQMVSVIQAGLVH